MPAVTRLGLAGGIQTPYAFDTGPGPDQFTFTPQTGVALSQVGVTSNTVVMTGLTGTQAVSVAGSTGYGYSKNGGAFVTAAGTAVNGDTFAVRVDSSASYNDGTNVTLTVGAVVGTFQVQTLRDPAPVASLGINVRRLTRRGSR